MWIALFHIIRNVLEVLYFCSGIVFVFVAIRGLRQIKVSKQIAVTTAKREAYKLASEQCDMFASRVVPSIYNLHTALGEANVTLFQWPARYLVPVEELV
jgi:hypothetical protein